jgi:predicted lipoprotein with Yx(FWY)xxD motif
MLAIRRIALFAAAALVAVACTGAGSAPSAAAPSAPSSSAAAGQSAAAAVTIGTASSTSFGTVLTGPTGMTLYTYAPDTSAVSKCTGECASEWPPLVTTGQAMLGAGLTGQLGTLTRPDGTTQVSYGGRPLYYWEGDKKAGDVTGNGIDGFAVASVGGAKAAPSAAPAAAPASVTPYKY